MTFSYSRTDAYKLSMAEAGAPLREETFYYSHRRGGWHFMPLDAIKFVQELLPPTLDCSDLEGTPYNPGAATRKAYASAPQITAVPKGAWFYDREPAIKVKGTSALTSWLEPTILSLNFRIQLATAIELERRGLRGANIASKVRFATCHREREIILETFDQMMVRAPTVLVEEDQYYDAVLQRASDLVKAVENPNQIFEVGMRAVSCLEQHEIVLRAVQEAGITKTSNVELALKLGMTPVGTMGHEHPQRFGDDYSSYIAMRDRFPGFVFYLPDTYSTLLSGIPSALRAIAEQPDRPAGIRFDSEHNIRSQYLFTISKAREMGLNPWLALESGWNLPLTVEFEELRKLMGWSADKQAYGYGGYLVKPPWDTFQRDDVQAVYKISQSGSLATMKFGDEPNSGKESIPGNPIIWRPLPVNPQDSTPAGFIAQEGENWRPSIASKQVYGEPDVLLHVPFKGRLIMSPATQDLISQCRSRRANAINNLREI